MDEDLKAAREAERKAAELHYLGWEAGAGATIWARAAQDVLALLESARERFAANPTVSREVWERFHGAAFMLIVAIDQVLAFERRIRRLTGDAELAKARSRFDVVCPGAEDLRDMVAHLDVYAIGQGRRQQPTDEGTPPPICEQNLAVTPFWLGNSGDTYIDLGDNASTFERRRRQQRNSRKSSSKSERSTSRGSKRKRTPRCGGGSSVTSAVSRSRTTRTRLLATLPAWRRGRRQRA